MTLMIVVNHIDPLIWEKKRRNKNQDTNQVQYIYIKDSWYNFSCWQSDLDFLHFKQNIPQIPPVILLMVQKSKKPTAWDV